MIAAVCGCGGVAPRHAEPMSAPGAPVYAALFAPQVWTLRGAAAGTAADPVTCRVVSATHVGEASVAKVGCDKPHDDLGVVGWWVATPAGLYHPYIAPEGPDDIAALGEDDLLINARPAERHHAISLGPTQETVDVVALDGGAWCVTSATTFAREHREWTLCVGVAGMVGVADEVTGEQVQPAVVRAGMLPPPPEPTP